MTSLTDSHSKILFTLILFLILFLASIIIISIYEKIQKSKQDMKELCKVFCKEENNFTTYYVAYHTFGNYHECICSNGNHKRKVFK